MELLFIDSFGSEHVLFLPFVDIISVSYTSSIHSEVKEHFSPYPTLMMRKEDRPLRRHRRYD